MRPEDFWRLTPAEFWWLVEARRPMKMYGSMTESEVADLHEQMVEWGMIKENEDG